MALAMRRCRRCGENRNVGRYVGTRGRICDTCRTGTRRVGTKNQRLQETYGITHEEWSRILESQGGVCAICGGVRKGKGGLPLYDVDHDHAMERALIKHGWEPLAARRASIRGLICKRDNRRLLPSAQDSVERLESAIDYLINANDRTQGVLAEGIADTG